jgi:hypothetical protein
MTGAFSATLVVPFSGLTVTAAARWADKLAAELVAVVEPLCTVPQAETVIAAANTTAPMAPSRLTERQYVVFSCQGERLAAGQRLSHQWEAFAVASSTEERLPASKTLPNSVSPRAA